MHHLVAEPRRRPEDEEGLECTGSKADLLLELAAGALLGRLARVAPAGRQLPHERVDRVAVLAHEDDAAVVEHRQRGHGAALADDLAQPPHTAGLEDLVHVEVEDLSGVDAAVLQPAGGRGRGARIVAHGAG